MRRLKWSGASVLLLLCIGAPARAQDTFSGFGSSQFMDAMMNNIRTDSLLRSSARDEDDGPRTATVPRRRVTPAPQLRNPVPVRAVATTYRASPAVTARVREQFLAFVKQTSGAKGETALRAVMAKHNVLALWAKQAAGDGLMAGDVADAYTAYWVQNWQMANGVETVPPSQMRAVRRQVARSMNVPLSEAQRQELAEVFIYNQFVQGSAWIDAAERGDQVLKGKLGDAAVLRFKREMRVDLRSLDLNDAGFIAR